MDVYPDTTLYTLHMHDPNTCQVYLSEAGWRKAPFLSGYNKRKNSVDSKMAYRDKIAEVLNCIFPGKVGQSRKKHFMHFPHC